MTGSQRRRHAERYGTALSYQHTQKHTENETRVLKGCWSRRSPLNVRAAVWSAEKPRRASPLFRESVHTSTSTRLRALSIAFAPHSKSFTQDGTMVDDPGPAHHRAEVFSLGASRGRGLCCRAPLQIRSRFDVFVHRSKRVPNYRC